MKRFLYNRIAQIRVWIPLSLGNPISYILYVLWNSNTKLIMERNRGWYKKYYLTKHLKKVKLKNLWNSSCRHHLQSICMPMEEIIKKFSLSMASETNPSYTGLVPTIQGSIKQQALMEFEEQTKRILFNSTCQG